MISELNPYLPPEAPPPPGGLNPWTSMWLQPRATIRQIVTEDPEEGVLVLALLSSIPSVLGQIFEWSSGDDLPTLVRRALTIALLVLITVGCLFLGARLLRWTGSWFGGTANLKELRAAIAWSSVPALWALPLVALNMATEHLDLFAAAPPSAGVSLSLSRFSMGLTAVQVGIGLWGMVVFLLALSEVQGFSVSRALGNALFTGLIIFGPFLALGLFVFAMAAR
jgi:hypothetical protein